MSRQWASGDFGPLRAAATAWIEQVCSAIAVDPPVRRRTVITKVTETGVESKHVTELDAFEAARSARALGDRAPAFEDLRKAAAGRRDIFDQVPDAVEPPTPDSASEQRLWVAASVGEPILTAYLSRVGAVRFDPTIAAEISAPQLEFMSTVPLNRTEFIHEYHRDNAAQTSRQIHAHPGGGSRLFVFSRTFRDRGRARRSSPPPKHPAVGLSLLDLQGNVVATLAQAGVGDLGVADPWWACSLELNPGPYRLRLDVPGLASLEQVVVASPGWQTQVFLLLDDYGDSSSSIFRADLETASILMAREHDGFKSGRRDAAPHRARSKRAREGARQGREGPPRSTAQLGNSRIQCSGCTPARRSWQLPSLTAIFSHAPWRDCAGLSERTLITTPWRCGLRSQ